MTGANGSVRWTAIPPEGAPQDSWTAVRLEGPRVIARPQSAKGLTGTGGHQPAFKPMEQVSQFPG